MSDSAIAADNYDQETIEIMRRVLRPASNCVDGGAHQGLFVRQMIRLAPEGRHQAIEPLRHLAQHLRTAYPQATVHECALGETPGEAKFQFVVNDPAYSGLRQRKYDIAQPKIVEVPVTVARLDDLLPPELPIDFIKLDLEGGDYHALCGARRTLARWRPTIVFEFGLGAADFYGVTPHMMWDLLGGECSMSVTTLARWLAGEPSLTREAFIHSYETHADFYFAAFPRS